MCKIGKASYVSLALNEGDSNNPTFHLDSTIRYDTIEEINVDSKAEYTA